jgi:isochorismate hydrolase
VIFPVDGTARSNRRCHEAALLNLAHSCARMVTVNQVAEAMEPG